MKLNKKLKLFPRTFFQKTSICSFFNCQLKEKFHTLTGIERSVHSQAFIKLRSVGIKALFKSFKPFQTASYIMLYIPVRGNLESLKELGHMDKIRNEMRVYF